MYTLIWVSNYNSSQLTLQTFQQVKFARIPTNILEFDYKLFWWKLSSNGWQLPILADLILSQHPYTWVADWYQNKLYNKWLNQILRNLFKIYQSQQLLKVADTVIVQTSS